MVKERSLTSVILGNYCFKLIFFHNKDINFSKVTSYQKLLLSFYFQFKKILKNDWKQRKRESSIQTQINDLFLPKIEKFKNKGILCSNLQVISKLWMGQTFDQNIKFINEYI